MNNSNFFSIEQAKILVVDDRLDNLEVLSRILEKHNYRVRCVSNGAEALEIARSGWVELMLLDVRMPEINGYEVCQRLKDDEQTQHIPVIFLSALDDALDKVKAFQVGGADYITKPFQFQEVLIRVENQLTIYKTQSTIRSLNQELEEKIRQRMIELETLNQQLTIEVEQRQQAQDKLLKLALNDPTTGLPNRNAFLGQLKQLLIKYQKESYKQFAILLISYNLVISERGKVGFPEIKCYLDHLALNQLLIAIAHRLQSCLPTSITLSRCEGNEFAIILENITGGKSEIKQWIHIIEKQFDKDFEITYITLDKQEKTQELTIVANIGVTIVDGEYSTGYDILHDAEIAVCQAQLTRDSNHYFFNKKNFDIKQLSGILIDDSAANVVIALKQLKSHFREALKREKINLYYQPIFSLANAQKLEIIGLEVFSDRHNYKKLIALTSFVRDIDSSKLNVYLSNFTLDYACYYLKKLQMQHETQQKFFLTMQFGKQCLLQHQFVHKLEQIINKIKLNPQDLHLDIIGEEELLNDKQILYLIPELYQLGVTINLNYVNITDKTLENISNLSFSSFKIPSSMTAKISDRDPEQNTQIAIAKIIYLAHQKNIKVTAKGIENEEQLIYLKSLGCDCGQGSLFSEPLDMESLDTFLVWRI